MTESQQIQPVRKLHTTITAPPSKAHTLRAIFIASLAKGPSVLYAPLLGEDQLSAIACMTALGANISFSPEKIIIQGTDGHLFASQTLDIKASGMTCRALASIAALSKNDVCIDGVERMRTGRPLQDLLDALKLLGVESSSNNGCVPVHIKAGSFKGGETFLNGEKSSQYFSSIFIAAPYAKEKVVINTSGGLSSKPYIDITIDIMKDFGVTVLNHNYEYFEIVVPQKYVGREYVIEGDYSSASFFFAAAAVTKGTITVCNLRKDSSQGDKKMLELLQRMGCSITWNNDSVTVVGGDLVGIKQDMNDYPDIVMPLAVVAAYAKGTTKLTNIAHLKYKESDRLSAPAAELRKMGINAHATDDALIIEGGTPCGAEIETYGDHRMAMSFAVAGLVTPGMVIKNPEVVAKSFPDFWDVFSGLYS